MDEKVDILLASYNGSKFIKRQIDSILNQTHQNFTIIVGDDASTDNTPAIIKEMQQKYPEKITFFEFKNNVGPRENFSRLADYADADYIMFSDQDDVWLPHKIEVSLAKIKELEAIYGSDEPILIATDAIVVDDDLNELYPSFMKYALFKNPNEFTQLNKLLMQNSLMGYSQLFNKALLHLMSPIPSESRMHDDWTALTAAALGKIGFVNEPTLLYRQHHSQFVGAIRPNFIWFLKKISSPRFVQWTEVRLMQLGLRAYILYRRYHEILPEDTKEMLLTIIRMKENYFWKELKYRRKYHLFSRSLWENIIFLVISLKLGKLPEKYRFKL